jgi:SAM-dependent methyltransferase
MAKPVPPAVCPICKTSSVEALKSIRFSPKPHLPEAVSVRSCCSCDFMFVRSDKTQHDYRQYYAQAVNDMYDAFAGDSDGSNARAAARYQYEAAEISASLRGDRGARILDYGCGSGVLLNELDSMGYRSLYGVDLMPKSLEVGRAMVTHDQAPQYFRLRPAGGLPSAVKRMQFDLVICSHVLEHVLDFDVLTEFYGLLKPRGQLYLEVPDATRYHEFPRLEFYYYYDRLHVNHFSRNSLQALLSRYGFRMEKVFQYQFAYSGGDYPALGGVFTKSSTVQSVFEAFSSYMLLERERGKQVEAEIRALGVPVLMYGAGDNFFRNLSVGGPLNNVPIACILDRRFEDFPAGLSGIPVVSPEVGLRKFPDNPVVILVSSDRAGVRKFIESIGPEHRHVVDL